MPGTAVPPEKSAPSVLLVDDRPENLIALTAVLEPLVEDGTLRLATAQSADDALRQVLLLGDSLAVVLLDVMMPGTDGFGTARLIRQRARSQHVPVIFITALDADRRRVNLGYQSGAVDYLTKPLDAEIIRGKVRAFVDLHQRRGQSTLAERRRYADVAAEAERVAQGRLEAARGDEVRVVETFQRMGILLAAELDLGRLVQAVTEEATVLTNAQFGAFFYNTEDETGEAYSLYALAGVDSSHVASVPHPRAKPVFGPEFRGEGVLRSDDITSDDRYGQMSPHFGMLVEHLLVRSYLAVPVKSRAGAVLGGLFFGHADTAVFGDREARLALGIAGWAAVAMDNARLHQEERNARGEAERRRAEAEAANRAKSEFLTMMSHELRTPLNAIGGHAELIEIGVHGPVTAAQREALDRIQRSKRHLAGLVNAVLGFARIEAGAVQYTEEDVPLTDVIATVAGLIEPQAAAKGIALTIEGSREVEGTAEPRKQLTARADEEKVRQILLNLLGNSVKFTPAGGRISVSAEVAGDGSVGVRVRDTGVGIPADKIERIFDAFMQVDGTLTRVQDGVGLGLAISRDLARHMGGDITVESEEGRGSIFTLTLPGS